MLTNEQIDQFIDETTKQLKEMNERFEGLNSQVKEFPVDQSKITDKERKAAQDLLEEQKQKIEIDSVNHNYALNQKSDSPKSVRYARRRNMI